MKRAYSLDAHVSVLDCTSVIRNAADDNPLLVIRECFSSLPERNHRADMWIPG
jgi:hypothetical protein